jgi:hypothetical protein
MVNGLTQCYPLFMTINPLKTFAAGFLFTFLASSAVAQTKLPSGPVPDGMTYSEWIAEVRKKDAQRFIDEGPARPWDAKPDRAPISHHDFLKGLGRPKE